jgi:F-box and WD-40 domain protein 1/11
MVLQIIRHLDARDLAAVEQVNTSWRTIVDNSVWRDAYLRKYERRVHTNPPSIQVGGIGCGRANQPKQQWKRMYKARLELEKNWRAGPKDAGKAIYLSGHTDSVYCVQFDEEKIITGSRDRTIRVWDINNFTCQRVIGGPNMKPVAGPKVLRTVDYPDFHLATASVNGTAYGDTIYHTPSQWHDASILCLQYDEEILVTGSSDSDLLVWDITTYEPIKRLSRHTGGVLDVALDGKHIVSCSKDSRIIVWDRSTFEPKGELTGHRGPVNAVQLRGKYLVSASGDGIARLWDIEAMKLVKEFSAKERGLAAVEFSEDMKYVLAGGNDTITYKFEVETGKEVKQFTGHSQLVRSLWLDSQNSRVVSGSYDLDLRVYDFDSGEEIWRAEEWTTSWMLAAKSDYRRIVATSQDGRILIIDFGLQKCRTPDDGQPIPGVDLLRGLEHTSIIEWVDPWERAREQEKERRLARMLAGDA